MDKHVLDNGVRVVTERQPHAYSVTLGLWVRVGSRDEDPTRSGVSHFIEHMAFKGTSRRSPLDIAREIDRLGGHGNAFTGRESTCYHARALPARLPDLCDLLTDILLNPAFAPKELERERQVILQEIASQEDSPEELVHVLFGRNFWPGHPLGWPVLGSIDSVSQMGRDDILAYQTGTYVPSSMLLTATGDLHHEEVVELVSEALGALPAAKEPAPRELPQSKGGLNLVHRKLEQVHLVLGCPAPAVTDERRFTAALLNLVLGGTMSSRLFQEVREKRGLAYSVYSFLSTYSDSGMLGVYLGVAPGRSAEALRVVKDQLAKMAAAAVTDEELADAKENLTASILLAAESPDARMMRLARNEFHFGREVTVEELVGLVEAVSKDQLALLAGELLHPGMLSVTALGPADGDALHKEMDR